MGNEWCELNHNFTYFFSIFCTNSAVGQTGGNSSKPLSNLLSGIGVPTECFIISIINCSLFRCNVEASFLQHPVSVLYSVSFLIPSKSFTCIPGVKVRSNVQMSLFSTSHGLFARFLYSWSEKIK